WQWIMQASWAVKVLILLVAAAVAFGATNFELLARSVERSAVALRVAFPGGRAIPLAPDTAAALDATAKRLSATLPGDLLALNAPNSAPWSTAQDVVAAGPGKLDKGAITAFIRDHAAPGCACWVELPEEHDAPHAVFISGWVMSALAALGVPATEDELHF